MDAIRRFRADDGYGRWLRWTAWPLVALGLAFLVVLILPLAADFDPTTGQWFDLANVVIWAVFVVDYLARLSLVQDRRRFVRHHLLDLVVIAVPFLRPFRVLRLLAIIVTTSRRAGGLAVRRVTLYVIGVAVLVTSVGAVVVYDAEKDTPLAARTVLTLGDAFWWSIVTVTTVGYGDVVPRSPLGRAVAAVVMVTGIALVGTVTAAVASWFVNVVRTAATAEIDDSATDERAELREQLRELSASVADLRREVRELTASGGTSP